MSKPTLRSTHTEKPGRAASSRSATSSRSEHTRKHTRSEQRAAPRHHKHALGEQPGLWQHVLLALLIIGFCAFQLFLILQTSWLGWDETVFLSNARALRGEGHYQEEFRPPLLPLAIAGVWTLTGESVLAARGIAIAAAAIAILLVYALAARRTRAPLVFAALFALDAQLLFWAGFAYAETLGLALVLGGMLLLERGHGLEEWEDSRRGSASRRGALLTAGAGLLLSLAFLARYPLAVVSVTVFSWLLWRAYRRSAHRRRGREEREEQREKGWWTWRLPLAYAIGASVPLVPWMLTNLATQGTPFWNLLTYLDIVGTHTTAQPVLPFIGTIVLLGGPLLVVLLWGLLIEPSRESEKAEGQGRNWMLDVPWIACLLVLLAFHLFVVRLKLPRYWLALLPFLVVIAATRYDAIVRWALPAFDDLRIAGPVIGTVLLLATIPAAHTTYLERDWLTVCSQDDAMLRAAEHLGRLLEEDGKTGPGPQGAILKSEGTLTSEGNEAETRVVGKPGSWPNVTVISNAWVHIAYLGGVRGWSLYTTNWTEIYQNVTPDYVLVAEAMGDPYDLGVLEAEQRPGPDGWLVPAGAVTGSCDTIRFWRARYDSPAIAESTTRAVIH